MHVKIICNINHITYTTTQRHLPAVEICTVTWPMRGARKPLGLDMIGKKLETLDVSSSCYDGRLEASTKWHAAKESKAGDETSTQRPQRWKAVREVSNPFDAVNKVILSNMGHIITRRGDRERCKNRRFSMPKVVESHHSAHRIREICHMMDMEGWY